MSKPIKELLRNELTRRFEGLDSLAVVGFTGLDAVTTNQVRSRLIGKQIRLMVVKNALAKQAFKQVGLDEASALLEGPCAIAYGSDSVVSLVRELLEIGKEAKALTVKGAVMEGAIFRAEQIEELSRYPTREEAIARVAGTALSPARKLAACVLSGGSRIASILKTIEDKAQEAAPEAAA